MSKFDGTDEPLTYGQAIAELVGRCSWPSEAHRDEVRDTILKEHGLYNEPDPIVDPEDIAREKELAALREDNRKLKAAAAARDKDAELARLKAENEKLTGGGTDGYEYKTVVELQALLSERGLSTAGRKDELVARLEEADAAQK